VPPAADVEHLARLGVDRGCRAVAAQVDPVGGVPGRGSQLEVTRPARAGQQLGQQDPVVRGARLLTQHDHLHAASGPPAHDLLDDLQPGHPGPDHHNPLRGGWHFSEGGRGSNRVFDPDRQGLELGLL
jgi:hypothetical protein